MIEVDFVLFALLIAGWLAAPGGARVARAVHHKSRTASRQKSFIGPLAVLPPKR